jgi:putative component of toxin-antitoxin plasmid stabilization module
VGNVKASNDAQRRVRRLRNTAASGGEVVGTGVDEVRIRVGRQPTMVYIHLYQIAYLF